MSPNICSVSVERSDSLTEHALVQSAAVGLTMMGNTMKRPKQGSPTVRCEP